MTEGNSSAEMPAQDDKDLLDRMIQAWFQSADDRLCKQYKIAMRRVLAVVREHDQQQAPALQRVPVQIVNMTQPNDAVDSIIALANDGSLHQGKYENGGFLWGDRLPPLPQPGEG